MTAHTTLRFLHRHGISTLEYCSHCSAFSGGLQIDASLGIQSGDVCATYGGLIGNGLYAVWKRNLKKLLSMHRRKWMAAP